MKNLLFTFCFLFFVFFYTIPVLSEECITQEQLESEITKERKKWDINNDNIYGIEEVIYVLQSMAGINNIEGLHLTWKGKNRIYYKIYADDTAIVSDYLNKDETDVYDLSPGDYRVVFNTIYGSIDSRTFDISIYYGMGKLIAPPVGNLKIPWNGQNSISYNVYVEDTSIVSGTIYNNETDIHDLAPGDYRIFIDNIYTIFTVHQNQIYIYPQ